MKMKRVYHEAVKEPPPETWSNCKVYGNHVYVAGVTARSPNGGVVGEGDVYAQARDIFEKIEHLIGAAGGKMNDIIKVNIYVTDIARREEVWKARREFFTGDFPASTLVEVSALALPEMLVEIEAIGFIGAGSE